MAIVMTLKEASKYLRLNKSTVYRLAQEGKIPASKIGKVWRFKKEKIDRWFDQIENKKRKNR